MDGAGFHEIVVTLRNNPGNLDVSSAVAQVGAQLNLGLYLKKLANPRSKRKPQCQQAPGNVSESVFE